MPRVFKIKTFARDARKAKIADDELCRVARKAQNGQFHADYGGGLLKTKVNKAEHRGMILMKGGGNWVFALLFAKKDRESITQNEEDTLKILAEIYSKMDDAKLKKALDGGEIIEICRDEEDEEDEEDGDEGS